MGLKNSKDIPKGHNYQSTKVKIEYRAIVYEIATTPWSDGGQFFCPIYSDKVMPYQQPGYLLGTDTGSPPRSGDTFL